MISILVPAHNEETVIDRCLRAILDGALPGELEVIVICNGCSDGTARRARAYGNAVMFRVSLASRTNRSAYPLHHGDCFGVLMTLISSVFIMESKGWKDAS